jgi:hypothetical protein
MEYGGCSRFWYGGCEGNDNRFSSQEECKEKCVEPSGRGECHAVVRLKLLRKIVLKGYFNCNSLPQQLSYKDLNLNSHV